MELIKAVQLLRRWFVIIIQGKLIGRIHPLPSYVDHLLTFVTLSQLLDGENRSNSKSSKKKQMTPTRDEISVPLFICSDTRKTDDHLGRRKTRRSSASCISSDTRLSSGENAAVDGGVAVNAVVSMLGGYIGRYLRDKNFRRTIREKCNSFLSRGEPDVEVLDNLSAAINGIEKLADDQPTSGTKPLRLLNAVSASLTTGKTINGGGVSACVQFYLSVIHKMEKNDTSSARHLLQIFVDAPFLARTHLLPDLWEHLFLPHLLHIKVWYSSEVERLYSSSDSEVKKRRLKELSRVNDCQMDVGTARFALYYKQWLKVGVEAPPIPQIPVPPSSAASRSRPRRRASSDSYSSKSSINTHLYQTVFGTNHHSRRGNTRDSQLTNPVPEDIPNEEHSRSTRRSSSQSLRYSKPELLPEMKKSTHSCRTVPIECFDSARIGLQIKDEEEDGVDDLSKAISIVCCSDNLSECELAVQLIALARLNPKVDYTRTEALISKSTVMEGMVEILFASNDDEVLELVVSLLSEIISKNQKLGQIVLNSDPQLKTFLRLLRRTNIFLKAAVLLYLLKPKAKQMISTEWVPLLLRVLEFGDHVQTLFTVRCVPRVAALYLLEQLLLGFDEDKNLDNAREVVSIGGLGFLIKRIEIGDSHERSTAAVMTLRCIQADGSCRNYIAENLNKASLLELLVLEIQSRNRSALCLLIELLFLGQRKQIIDFLKELGSGYGGLNTMHILLVHLVRSSLEERPLIAVLLLQLDLMGDSAKSSVFREEAIEAITDALENCRQCNDKIQEKSARALTILGWFSRTGEAITEKWLLHKSGFKENQDDTFCRNMNWVEDEDETKIWFGKIVKVLLKNKNKNFLIALSGSIADAIPVLARASLVMFTWLSSFLHLVEDDEVLSTMRTLFIPQMLQLIVSDNSIEDRVLASSSLLHLSQSSGGSDLIPFLNEESIHYLRNLSLVTWTAKELVSIIASRSRHHHNNLASLPFS